jgi:NADH dehydrogenase
VNVVTGALSYLGRAIAEELLARGEDVRSLSRRDVPGDPLRERIEVAPLDLDDPDLRGATALYNTYWIRFERGAATFDQAVDNTIRLFEAARRAGVERIVHISVANADRADDLAYFRGKHAIERWLATSGLPYAIVRPTLVFGANDILVNNIAWIVRRSPLFLVPGRNDYLVQPVSVGDTARIVVDAPLGATIDAAGPETVSFAHLVVQVRDAVGARCVVARGPRAAGLLIIRGVGAALGDVVVTREELLGLERSLLTSPEAPLGVESFSAWLGHHADMLGRSYVSELGRNFR